MSVKKRTWKEFREAGLLWWINRQLHLFGWALVVEVDEDTGEVTKCYPANVDFKGFSRESEENGFKKLEEHIRN